MTPLLLPKVRKRPRRQKPNDDAFRAWIQTLPSCLSGAFSEYANEDGATLHLTNGLTTRRENA